MSGKAVLTLDGKQYEFDTLEGTEGEKAVDFSKFRARTGYVTPSSYFSRIER